MTDALRMRVRAVASRSEGYHIALAVAQALSRLAVEPANEHAFVTTFLTRRIPLHFFRSDKTVLPCPVLIPWDLRAIILPHEPLDHY